MQRRLGSLASGTGGQTLQVASTGSYPLEWTSKGLGSNLESGTTRGGQPPAQDKPKGRMVKQETINEFELAFKNLDSIDKHKLFRSTLGNESLQSALEPKLTKTLNKFRIALEYAPAVSDTHIRPMIGLLQNLYEELNAQAQRESAEYIQNREGVLSALDSINEEILQNWPAVVAAAIEARGFLEDEGIRKEYENAAENLKMQATSTLDSIKEESQKILDGSTRGR